MESWVALDLIWSCKHASASSVASLFHNHGHDGDHWYSWYHLVVVVVDKDNCMHTIHHAPTLNSIISQELLEHCVWWGDDATVVIIRALFLIDVWHLDIIMYLLIPNFQKFQLPDRRFLLSSWSRCFGYIAPSSSRTWRWSWWLLCIEPPSKRALEWWLGLWECFIVIMAMTIVILIMIKIWKSNTWTQWLCRHQDIRWKRSPPHPCQSPSKL